MRNRAKQRQAGFTLLEVLVSVVVLSVALLGTAALTANSLKANNTSYYLSQATVMADDILDRMRANITQARDGQYNIALNGSKTAGANTLENFDCTEWLATLAQTLPQGKGSVNYDGGVVTIVINWDDQSFTTMSQL